MRDVLDRLERLLGRADDVSADEILQPEAETKEMLDNHKRTLVAVKHVLTDSQRRVVAAIDETADAIERKPR